MHTLIPTPLLRVPSAIVFFLKNAFMRQVIILARECGLKLELSDIPPESLVPEPLRVSITILFGV